MTDVTILAAITKPTSDNFVMPDCVLTGCNCAIRISYPCSARAVLHVNIGDTLSVGTRDECNAGTKDIVRKKAEGLSALGWAKIVETE